MRDLLDGCVDVRMHSAAIAAAFSLDRFNIASAMLSLIVAFAGNVQIHPSN
jgi:hypothetical protein